MSHSVHNENLRRFAYSRPIVFSILVIIVSGLVTEIPFDAILDKWFEPPAPELLKVTLGHTLLGIALVWLLKKLDMLKAARFTHPREWRAVWLVWPFLVFTLLNLDSVISGHLAIDTSRPGMIILFVFLNLSIGFAEEVMGRGVILWEASKNLLWL